MTEVQPVPAALGAWHHLSPAEHEDFFAAIARHRRDSWRVTAACGAAVLTFAAVVALLMAPLLYCLCGLAFDIVNLVVSTPDAMGWMGRSLDPVFSGHATAGALLRVGAVAAFPGLALMGAATLGLRHVWLTSPLFDSGDVPGRAPDRSRVSEARLANVVEEMAIAAGIPAPRVLVVAGGANAAAFGRDESHVTILAGEALASSVDREQLQGMIAHLVGSIADGDMTIGLRVSTTLGLFGLVTRLGGSFSDRRAFREAAKLWRLLVAPTSEATAQFLGEFADPFRDAGDGADRPAAEGESLTWREWALMPLMGPIVLTGFLSGMVSQFLLLPLIAVAWRQRKYMADATAVRLTRDPDGLAHALEAVADSPKGIVSWTVHLAVAPDSGTREGLVAQSFVPIFPAAERRIKALAKMGASVDPRPQQTIPWPLLAVGIALLAILGGLMAVAAYLLVLASAALSGLFTVLPAAILHALLRWIAS